jgi:hypothetical protein
LTSFGTSPSATAENRERQCGVRLRSADSRRIIGDASASDNHNQYQYFDIAENVAHDRHAGGKRKAVLQDKHAIEDVAQL